MDNAFEGYKDILRKAGFRVEIDTPYCKERKVRFPDKNCEGCESEDGCSRYVGIMGVLVGSMAYKPSTFDDHQKQQAYISKSLQIMLDKSSTKKQRNAVL